MEKCGQCGKRGDTNAIRRCSRCQAIRYCSRDCQARHWPQHKVTCTPATNPTVSSSSAKNATDQRKPTSTEKKLQPSTELPAAPNPGPWQQARSRALAAFPGSRVVDRFDDLERVEMVAFGPMIFGTSIPEGPELLKGEYSDVETTGVVMVVKLVSPIFHPLRHQWTVVDRMETSAHVRFGFLGLPGSQFRTDDLQKGHFLCVKHAHITLFPSDVHVVIVTDVSSVRVFSV